MNNIERRNLELPYIADMDVLEEQRITRRLLQRFNEADRADFELLSDMAKEIVEAKGKNIFINPPFYCDYGKNIEIGDNFFANYNCTIIDVAKVKIGNNVMFAPNVSIYTAGHPIHPKARNSGYEYGISITIGDNVWVGGNVVILPGVQVGDNVVIGAGSVVTKDIPSDVVVAGNPARIVKHITEEDIKYYYKDKEFDNEAMSKINSIK